MAMRSRFIIFVLTLVFTESKAQLMDYEPDSNSIYTMVEKAPEFPGGLSALYEFIGSKISYPIEAENAGASGVVFLQFIVTETGAVDTNSIAILQSVHPALDFEAIRVVRMFPNFEPGTQHQKPVSVYFKMPFNFKLNVSPSGSKRRRKKEGETNK
jgi:TonB family protein